MVEHPHSLFNENDLPLVQARMVANENYYELHDGSPSAPPAYHDIVPMVVTPDDEDRLLYPEEMNEPEQSRIVASGAAGAVVGLLFGGPFIAAIVGFGAAYATQKEGAAGDIARAMGDIALTARERAREVDEKHHLVDKSKKLSADMWEKAKELDRQHHILEKFKDFLAFSWKAAVDFTRRHRLLERGVEGVGRGFEFIANNVSGCVHDTIEASVPPARDPARIY
jgi:hypothetical protein